ncbi:MAG: hypothetical protein H0V54_02595 [Chthoniobacterales bacterium]|nr:hypothetical protein [Chthoniobacterales bacterium]
MSVWFALAPALARPLGERTDDTAAFFAGAEPDFLAGLWAAALAGFTAFFATVFFTTAAFFADGFFAAVFVGPAFLAFFLGVGFFVGRAIKMKVGIPSPPSPE